MFINSQGTGHTKNGILCTYIHLCATCKDITGKNQLFYTNSVPTIKFSNYV